MSEPITIDIVNGGGDGGDLIGCYFKYKDGKYKFYDKDNKEKNKDLEPGASFHVTLDEYPTIDFILTIDPTSTETEVTGTWAESPETDPSADPDQTYTAQAPTIKGQKGAASANA